MKTEKKKRKIALAKVSYDLTFTTRGNIRKLFPIIFLNWLEQNELFRGTFVSPTLKKEVFRRFFSSLFYYFPQRNFVFIFLPIFSFGEGKNFKAKPRHEQNFIWFLLREWALMGERARYNCCVSHTENLEGGKWMQISFYM